MTWATLTENWAASYRRLQMRFPHLEDDAMAFVKQDHSRFISYLAASHALTYQEAEEALVDYLASLAAEADVPQKASA